MSFSTRRGRPRAKPEGTDHGTDELRRKHAAGLTAEPIDACLARGIISNQHHRSGLHLRWLYTLRYGAPSLTSRYLAQQGQRASPAECDLWRQEREREFHIACRLLHAHRHYEPVMRLVVFNEWPAFMNPQLRDRAFQSPALAERLDAMRAALCDGLELLARHWGHIAPAAGTAHPATID